MTYDHDKLLTITGGIVETARKKAEMTQSELANSLGVIQSTISRIEQGILAPTLFHWLAMCKILDIPEDAISIGYLDHSTTTKVRSGNREGGYTLPTAYSDFKCIKVRNYLPLFNFVREEFGEETLNKIILDLKMKPTFFLNLDNQVNVNFPDDFLITLGKFQKVDGRTMGRTLKYVPNENSHGSLSRLFKNASDQLDLMDRYLKNITKYHRVFTLDNYHLANDKITFEANFYTETHDALKEMGEEKDQFLWDFYAGWLKKFSLFDYKDKLGHTEEVEVDSTRRNEQGIRQVTISMAH